MNKNNMVSFQFKQRQKIYVQRLKTLLKIKIKKNYYKLKCQ